MDTTTTTTTEQRSNNSPKRGRDEVLNFIVNDENLPELLNTIEDAIAKYDDDKDQSDKSAVRGFLERLMKGGFWINYKSSIMPDDMKQGCVKWFDHNKGYGFITQDDGSPDVYISEKLLISANIISVKDGAKIVAIREGDRVEFVPTKLQNGKLSARFIKILPSK